MAPVMRQCKTCNEERPAADVTSKHSLRTVARCSLGCSCAPQRCRRSTVSRGSPIARRPVSLRSRGPIRSRHVKRRPYTNILPTVRRSVLVCHMTSMSLSDTTVTFLRLHTVFFKLPEADLVLHSDWKKGFLEQGQQDQGQVLR